jgi:hypothetical protein
MAQEQLRLQTADGDRADVTLTQDLEEVSVIGHPGRRHDLPPIRASKERAQREALPARLHAALALQVVPVPTGVRTRRPVKV